MGGYVTCLGEESGKAWERKSSKVQAELLNADAGIQKDKAIRDVGLWH